MSEKNMPAAEVASVVDEQELASYECAYHVLPTVAEGEVNAVREAIIAHIEQAGGIVLLEEKPQRFDLAYEIDKYIEGKNRKFRSAYFGWVRFTLDPAAVEALAAEIDGEAAILRYLLIRLTKEEVELPFFFHEARQQSKVRYVGEEDIDPNVSDDETEEDASEAEDEVSTDEDDTTK